MREVNPGRDEGSASGKREALVAKKGEQDESQSSSRRVAREEDLMRLNALVQEVEVGGETVVESAWEAILGRETVCGLRRRGRVSSSVRARRAPGEAYSESAGVQLAGVAPHLIPVCMKR